MPAIHARTVFSDIGWSSGGERASTRTASCSDWTSYGLPSPMVALRSIRQEVFKHRYPCFATIIVVMAARVFDRYCLVVRACGKTCCS